MSCGFIYLPQNILKKIFLFLLFSYLTSFCLVVYSHPLKTLEEWDWIKRTNIDYTIYQRAAENFINGKDIYAEQKYRYPPFFAMILSPLFILPKAIQKPLWVMLNLITVVSLWFLLVNYFTANGIKKYQAGAIALIVIASSVPLLHNFKWGQVSALISLLVIISYIAFKQNNYSLSALTLALASSIKIIPAVFLLFYIVNWKKGVLRLFVWFIVFSSFLLLLFPLISLGPESTCHHYKTYQKKMTSKDAWLFHGVWNNQTIRGIIFRYFSKDYPPEKGRKPFPPFLNRPPRFLPLQPYISAKSAQTAGTILSLILLMITLYLSGRKEPRDKASRNDKHHDMRFCLFISGFFAFTHQAWIHYYVLLIVPYYLLFISLLKKDIKAWGFPFILFGLSFATFHGNIFIIKSSRLLSLFEYLGFFYWANILLFLSLILHYHKELKKGTGLFIK